MTFSEDLLVAVLPALVLTVTASVFDWRFRKIPNKLVLTGLFAALAMPFVSDHGLPVQAILLGGLIGLVLYLPLYAVRWVGAGDAKLMAVVGMFVGPSGAALIAFYSFMAGGILGVAMLAVQGGWGSAWERLSLLFRSLVLRLRGVPIPMPVNSQGQTLRLPYALAILAGTFVWLSRNLPKSMAS